MKKILHVKLINQLTEKLFLRSELRIACNYSQSKALERKRFDQGCNFALFSIVMLISTAHKARGYRKHAV